MHLRSLLSVSLLVLVVVGCGSTQAATRNSASTTASTPTHVNTSTALSDTIRRITTTSSVLQVVASAANTITTHALETRTAATAAQWFVTVQAIQHIVPAAQKPSTVTTRPAVAALRPAARVAVVPGEQVSAANEPLMAVHGLSSGRVDTEEATASAAFAEDAAQAEAVPVAHDVATSDVANSKPALSMVQASTSLVEPLEPSEYLPNDPVRIVAPSIGMDEPVISVGLDEYNMPIVPNHDPGWYNLSARPGAGENIVFWGHVLRFQYAPEIPAPFGRVKELQVGAPITVYTADGLAHTYIVQTQVWAEPHQIEYILPLGSERLTLVSCIGDYIIVDGSVENMTNRLITIALPAS